MFSLRLLPSCGKEETKNFTTRKLTLEYIENMTVRTTLVQMVSIGEKFTLKDKKRNGAF